MHLLQRIAGLSAGLVLSASLVAAPQHDQVEQIRLSQCLAAKLSTTYPILAQDKDFRIIEVPAAELEQINRLADTAQCGRYVNVSHQIEKGDKSLQARQLLKSRPGLKRIEAPAAFEIRHPDAVNTALAQVQSDNIWRVLSHLTAYENRSATTTTGVETANWLKGEFERMATEYGRTDTKTYLVETGWRYKQPSVVTVIGKDLTKPGIVIGAHMDTLSGRMPGAGDDGSGSSTVMEMARVLLSSKLELKRPIYIIWYAAEERGLVGSQFVVQEFVKKSIPVQAAIQFDMTGYRAKAGDPTMYVYTDYTDKSLNNFVSELIKTYVKVPVAYSKCGYGCSDHASWMDEGVPAAFPCESSFDVHNPYIHTSSDTMALLSLEHMTNFTKLALAFAVELGLE